MNSHNGVEDGARRRLLQRSLALAAAAAVSAPAKAKSVHERKMRLRIEGDTGLDWVLSLYTPPILAAGLPPGTAARVRFQFPAPEGPVRHGHSRRTMAISAFLAPAGVPPGVPAPELAPISTFDVDVEQIMLDDAAFGEPSTRPSKNVGIIGRVVANQVESPFGSLVNRVLIVSFGFDWVAAGEDAANFKLVAGSAAGSHLTVLPEAAGEISFD
jgi:hypothetical protein